MDVPIHLYKYRSLRTKKDKEHTSRILTHNEIYFAKCSEFNDPFDCHLHISVGGDFNTYKVKHRQLNPDLSEAEINNQTRKALQPENIRKREQKVNSDIYRITKSAGIFSMSTKRDNILMWSHYADYHKGICIEFKTSSGKLFGCELLKVEYEKNYPKFSVYDDMNLERVRKYIGTKSSDWKYEEEWRIIYRETGCQRFPPEELSGVILGTHISKRNKELVYKGLSQNSCNVKLYEARECKDRFGLDIILIEQ
jgi:hypothetical protein